MGDWGGGKLAKIFHAKSKWQKQIMSQYREGKIPGAHCLEKVKRTGVRNQ